MYKYFFFNMYMFSCFMRKNVPGSFFHDTFFSAVWLMSGLEILNIATILHFIPFESITENTTLDGVIVFLFLLCFNYYYFKHNKRFIDIIKSLNSEIRGNRFEFLYFFYAIFSLVAFGYFTFIN